MEFLIRYIIWLTFTLSNLVWFLMNVFQMHDPGVSGSSPAKYGKTFLAHQALTLLTILSNEQMAFSNKTTLNQDILQ